MITSLLLMAAASSVPIEAGRFDPSEFPNAKRIERRMPHAAMTKRVEQMLADGRCSFEGQTKARFDIVVPYVVQLDAAGAPQRVVVRDMGCAPIERLAGSIALQLGEEGDFRTSHAEGKEWYVSELYFTVGNEMMAAQTADKDKVICKRSEPVLGTRTATKRICRTADEWNVTETDRDQFSRDLRHMGRVPATD